MPKAPTPRGSFFSVYAMESTIYMERYAADCQAFSTKLLNNMDEHFTFQYLSGLDFQGRNHRCKMVTLIRTRVRVMQAPNKGSLPWVGRRTSHVLDKVNAAVIFRGIDMVICPLVVGMSITDYGHCRRIRHPTKKARHAMMNLGLLGSRTPLRPKRPERMTTQR